MVACRLNRGPPTAVIAQSKRFINVGFVASHFIEGARELFCIGAAQRVLVNATGTACVLFFSFCVR